MSWRHVDGSTCSKVQPASLLGQGRWCVTHQQWFLVSGAPQAGTVPIPSGPADRRRG